MNIKKGYESYKKIGRKYLFVIFVIGLIIFLFYLGFIKISYKSFNSDLTNDLINQSNYTAEEFGKTVDKYMTSVKSLSNAIEEIVHSEDETLALLEKEEAYISCDGFGTISRAGKLVLTNQSIISVKNESWFKSLLMGYDISGEKISANGEEYVIFGVPVYKNGNTEGGVCCIVKESRLWSGLKYSEEFDFEILDKNAECVFSAEEAETGSIVKGFTEGNAVRCKNAIKSGKAEMIVQKNENINESIYVLPLYNSGYTLLGKVKESSYEKRTGDIHKGVRLICLGIFIVLVLFVISAVIFFRKSNQSVINHLTRVDNACNALKICYIIHSAEGGGEIYHKSKSVENVTGFSDAETEVILNNEISRLIHPEDRSAAMKAFKQIAASGESGKEVVFRLLIKDEDPVRFRDVVMINGKGQALTSVLIPAEKLYRAYEDLQNMRYRLDLVTQASSFYVMELNLKRMELYMSDNLKERLGYGLEAKECFKKSVLEKLIHRDSYSELEAMIYRYKRGNRIIRGRLMVKTSMGEYINLHVDAEVIGTILKNDVRIVAVLREIRKRSIKNVKNK